jgi:plastocyanin
MCRNGVLGVVATATIAFVVAGCGGSSSSGTTTSASASGQTATTTPTRTTVSTNTSATTSTTSGATTSGSTTSASTGATSGGSTATTTVLNIQASPSELAYVPNTLSAPAGRIIIRMTNPSQLQHSIALAVAGVTPGPVVGNGGVSEVVATLAPGTYTFYCTVPGHRQAGMTGTLTVH